MFRNMMLKVFLWLFFSLFTAGCLVFYSLKNQYEEQSTNFRILYREVTIKLSQNDTLLSLLPVANEHLVVQQKFPQVIAWKSQPGATSIPTILPMGDGTYWLGNRHVSLLIDPKVLIDDLPQRHYFRHIRLSWQNIPLLEAGVSREPAYWYWDKVVSSPSQPFLLSARNEPDWARLPWFVLLLSSLFWAGVVYFTNKYRMQKRQHGIAVLREHFSEVTRLNAMGEMTAGIVHELNQPLTAVLSYNQAALRLLKQQQGEKAAPLLDAAVIQIKRISTLLLQFRQRLVNDQVVSQQVDLSQVGLRVVMLLENEIQIGRVKVTHRLPADLPTLFAPPLWIEQIFHNILTNAIYAQRHNKSGSAWVTLSALATETGIRVEINDGGAGLSEQALQQVFIPFFTTRPDGLGLGMALTETLVQRLEGNIKVENRAGQGACFTLWFPFRQSISG